MFPALALTLGSFWMQERRSSISSYANTRLCGLLKQITLIDLIVYPNTLRIIKLGHAIDRVGILVYSKILQVQVKLTDKDNYVK